MLEVSNDELGYARDFIDANLKIISFIVWVVCLAFSSIRSVFATESAIYRKSRH